MGSWGSPGRSRSPPKWRPSSSGASAGRANTTTSTSPTSPSPGPTASPSAPSSTTSSLTPSTSRPWAWSPPGTPEELRGGLHDRREVRRDTRLPDRRGHVRHGRGEEDRSQDDLLLRAGGLQDVQRAVTGAAPPPFHGPTTRGRILQQFKQNDDQYRRCIVTL